MIEAVGWLSRLVHIEPSGRLTRPSSWPHLRPTESGLGQETHVIHPPGFHAD